MGLSASKLIKAFLFLSLLAGLTLPLARAMTVEEEKDIGRKVFIELEKNSEIVRDPIIERFLETVGKSLVLQMGPTPYDFRFYTVRAQEPNAFAIPGGYIFVTTGLLVLAQNEHEVAGVLSHEIAHISLRHHSQLWERAKKVNIAAIAAALAGMLLGGGGKAGEAVATTALAASEAVMLKYSRDNEKEADQNSLNLVLRAGYDPQGLVGFLNRMYRYGLASGPKMPAYLNTHPGTEERISLLENLIQIEGRRQASYRRVGNFKRVQARAFIEEREAFVAVSHFESSVKANPGDVDALYGLGIAYRKMGRLDKAIETLESAARASSEDYGILGELGITYFLTGKVHDALEILERGSVLSEGRPESKDYLMPMFYLGRTYLERGNLPKAIDILQRVRKEMPEFPDVYLHLGSAYGRAGMKGQSHLYYGKHFRLRGDINNALLHFRTALMWLEKGDADWNDAQREIEALSRGKG